MKTVKLLFLFSSLLMISISLHAQPTAFISGTVTNNGHPLAGVNIRIDGSSKGAFTDTDGKYAIQHLEAGVYMLVISYVGFKNMQRSITLENGVHKTLNIELEESAEEMQQMVVTGTMRERYVKDSPVKVDVVNVRRLEQSRVSANMMDLIDGVNGLSTQLNCGVCGTNAIRINGVEGPNTAVLVDGMPVMGALASVYGLNGINPSIIDQVEVIKGPQSTLYGTQALGGVVNIITKNPDRTPTFSADAYGQTTTGEGSINLAASPDMGPFQGFVSTNLLRNERYFDNNNDGFDDRPKQSRIAIFGKGVMMSDNNEQRLNFAAKYYNENRTGGVQGFTDDLRGSSQIYGESIYTRRAELLTEYRPAGLNEQLRLNGALTYHSQDSFYGDELYDATQQIAFGQASWSQPVSTNLNLLIGSTLRYQTYNDNTPATSNGDDIRFIPGVFTQAEYDLGNFTFLGGMRVDHHNEHGFVTAPRLSAKYSPSYYTTFRVSGGTGFRVVNVFTEDHAALTGSREVVFREDLDPERSGSVTASLQQIIPAGNNPITIGIDAFYTRFSNKIIPDYDTNPNLIIYENLDGFSVTQGASIELEQNFTSIPINYNANFTLMDVFTEENSTRRALAYAPDFIGNLGVTYQLRSLDASISYAANLTGSKRMPDAYVQGFNRDSQTPVFTTHDLKITKEFLNVNNPGGIGLEAYLSARNIFNFTQGTPLVDAATPFSPQFDTIYTWGPVVGRTLSIGARLNLR